MKDSCTFDPTQPATIFNSYPQAKWPFKRGDLVYFLTYQARKPSIGEGTVRFYNPALKPTYLVSEGHPVLTVESGNTAVVVSVKDVKDHTRTGKLALERRATEMLRTELVALQQAAEKLSEEIAERVRQGF